jgi:hypothetical protein
MVDHLMRSSAAPAGGAAEHIAAVRFGMRIVGSSL